MRLRHSWTSSRRRKTERRLARERRRLSLLVEMLQEQVLLVEQLEHPAQVVSLPEPEPWPWPPAMPEPEPMPSPYLPPANPSPGLARPSPTVEELFFQEPETEEEQEIARLLGLQPRPISPQESSR
jgi:hypothetical protein